MIKTYVSIIHDLTDLVNNLTVENFSTLILIIAFIFQDFSPILLPIPHIFDLNYSYFNDIIARILMSRRKH